MGFWRGLAVRLGMDLFAAGILGLGILLASLLAGDSNQVIVYSIVITPLLSIAAIAVIYTVFPD